MPILIATAAGAAATYGAYRGGKAAVADAKRKHTNRAAMREQRAEQDAKHAARQQAAQEAKEQAATLTVQERLDRYKQGNNNKSSGGETKKKGLLGRLRK